jgi:hypothetical protein
MVEGTVLLHQDHHMLDILNGSCGSVGFDGKSLLDGGRHHA